MVDLSGRITTYAVVLGSLCLLYPLAFRIRRRNQGHRLDGIEIIIDPLDKAKFEIVAVHGLGAHPEHTWQGHAHDSSEKVHLLRELLPKSFPEARILSFGHNSDWFVNAPIKTAQQIGERLLDELQTYRTTHQGPRLPICFIGHSFGGIIIKQALSHPAITDDIVKDTSGILFLGTPHQGSSLSLIGALAAWLTSFLGSSTDIPLSLRQDSLELGDLQDRFESLHKERSHVKMYSICETFQSYVFGISIGLVVSQNSAKYPASTVLRADTDHSGLNKCSGPKDNTYLKIQRAITDMRRLTLLDQADYFIRKSYSPEKIRIERLSKDLLEMETCYINLAIVDQEPYGKLPVDKLGSPRLRTSLLDQLKIEEPDDKRHINLVDMFKPRQTRDGTSDREPRRILIRGRPGVGKTTLCKKIVHDFKESKQWNDRFPRLLWIPLRKLSGREGEYGLEDLISSTFFSADKEATTIRNELSSECAKADATSLFLLDGLDEVQQLLSPDNDLYELMKRLLNLPNVIVTSRPSVHLTGEFLPFDIELETIGFYPHQAREYVNRMTEDKEVAKSIMKFLDDHPLIGDLVRIPIQLDAVCFAWGDVSQSKPETMTQLYQAVERGLRRKDFPSLGKSPKKPGQSIKPSDTDIETRMEPQTILLENLAFYGMHNGLTVFKASDLSKLRSPDGTLDLTLRKVSFLRSSDTLTDNSRESYFLHLTIQEYFAARYISRKWMAGDDVLLHNSSPRKLSPIAYFQQHKYTARYDMVWRFVAGLLDAKKEGESTHFFKEIEKEPVDLLGPAHQRLVMHCMCETVRLPCDVKKSREERMKQWVLFESELTGCSYLARERELPEEIFQLFLPGLGREKGILEALAYSGRHLSETTTTILVALLKDDDSLVRHFAARALGNQSNLSETTTTILVALLKDDESSVRSSAARALDNQSNLSETTTIALVALLKDENPLVRDSAAEALGKQSTLSDTTTIAVVAFFKDENSSVRYYAAEALGNQSTLSETTTIALVALLKDDDSLVRSSAARALGNQSTLSDTTTTALVAFFKDDDSLVRNYAARALDNQSNLSETTTIALVALLKDDDSSVQYYASRALGNQSTLSETTTIALVALLKDDDSLVRSSAAVALGQQPSLIDNILETLNLPLESEIRPTFRNPEHMEHLYKSLLWRSFQEQFSLYSSDSICIINQTSGFRKADLEDGKTFRDAISNGQLKLREDLSYNIWAPLEEENHAD